jgi:hypothetical protein
MIHKQCASNSINGARRMAPRMIRRTDHHVDHHTAHHKYSRMVERSCCALIDDEKSGLSGISHDASNAGFLASPSKART